MADAQATFTITLDPSGLKSGAAAGASALDKLRGRIQQQQKSLDALRGSMARLKGSASVVRFEAIPRELEKATAEASKLEAALAKVKAAQAAHEGGGGKADAKWWEKSLGLQDKAKDLESQIGGVTGKIKRLQGEQAGLADNPAVKAFQDQSARAKELEGSLADMQGQYDSLGGDPEELAKPVKGLKEALVESGTPLGNLVKQFDLLKKAGPAAAVVAVVVAVIALATAAIRGAIALAKFAAASADAARNAKIARQAAAFGTMAGTAEIEGAMRALRDNTALAKDEAQKLASELYRAGERGQGLEDAALTIARFGVLGEDAASGVKSLYDQLRKPAPSLGGVTNNSMAIGPDTLPRDVFLELANQLGKDGNRALLQGFTANRDDIRGALSRIGEQRFAGPALDQMRSLENLAKRWEEAKGSLFEGLKMGMLLAGLQKLVNLFDESSESGKAIRVVLAGIGQPIVDALSAALPYAEAFFEGVIIGALMLTLGVLKVKNAFMNMLPEGFSTSIDWLKVAMYAGVAVFVLFMAAVLAIGIALATLAAPFIYAAAKVALLVAAVVFAYDYITTNMDSILEYFENFDLSKAAGDIIDGLIDGIKLGAEGLYMAFTDLAKGGFNAFKSALGIKSPSRVFRMAARWIPAGAAEGIEDGSRDVEQAAANMVGPDAMAGGGAAKGTRGAVQVTMQPGAITITGVKDAEQIQTPAFERLLARVFTQWAASGGVPVTAEAT
jgi:hypothetical protein